MKLKVCCTLLLLAFLHISSFSQTTTIWLVRHAEKDTSVQSRDPDLSEQGKQRAVKLAAYLDKNKPDIIYSTNYKRTRQTAAQLTGEIKTYNPQDLKKFSAEILSQYKGKKILIIGHSNTILETLEALGGTRPVPLLSEKDYQYVFMVGIPENGEIKTTVDVY